MVQSMGGWKMKTGSFLVAIGVTLAGSAEVVPIQEAGPWLKFVGYLVGGVGTAFSIWGAGHKIEKNAAVGFEATYVLDQKCADIVSE